MLVSHYITCSEMPTNEHVKVMEIKIILVELIRNFRFIGVEKPFTIKNPGFALRPNGLEVRVEKVGS